MEIIIEQGANAIAYGIAATIFAGIFVWAICVFIRLIIRIIGIG
jgi:hypothetical protein